MSIEAFWSISFYSSINGELLGGSGVVIFETGRVFGGDSSFYYNGSYQLHGANMKARVRVKRFAPGLPALINDDYVLVVEKVAKGDFNSNEFMVEGHVDGQPAIKIYIGFSKIENLP